MHQNYHFLKHLTEALRPLTKGLKFMECFSQEKDELVIVLAQARGKNNYYRPFFIRAMLRPDFACFNFPDEFNRARQNSVDLFENLYDLEVTEIRQFHNERALGIVLDKNFTLVFKLFGNRSNAVLFENDLVIDLFHNKLVSDNTLKLSQLDRSLDQSWEAYEAANYDHRKIFPTFGKEINAYLEKQFTHVGAGLASALAAASAPTASAQTQIDIGTKPTPDAIGDIVGADAQAVGADSQAVGADAQAVSADSQAVSADSQTVGADSQAVGADSQAVGADAQAVGADAQAVGADAQAVSADSQAVSADSQAVVGADARPAPTKHRWQIIQNTLMLLSNPTFRISLWNHQPTLSLVPLGEVVREHTDPIIALNDFYTTYNRIGVIAKEKSEALKMIQKRIQRTEHYLEEAFQKLLDIDSNIKNEEIGHILMANLHQIPERAERVTLFDFYRNQDIDIKLKPDLTPQRNAESYYRKSKNERIEIEKLQENIALREGELEELKNHVSIIEAFESLKLLRKYLKNNNLLSDAPVLSPTQLFKHTEFDGYVILIGKNAKNNDLLTKKYAYKEDLWLHARDVAGSHVVVKYKAGKKIPNSVVERAAQIAAWYSKRRNETLCPVIVTPKKFVRKPKGLPEGEVILDKEEVVMVQPRGL
ncbi:NFACT RNA binding domain-containing protein [Runella sp. MFBS21]|uniref:NFACT RNA binding domain-containing protein n=1 Tax=Runella sp. MFBS21 TaxID=3034018 RepID=UPI0023F83228|nr:NFACT RNA binding domain-containing protein [Runella sp. MFBS21]MDF7816740.1 NFACT RNA binding domain-containing protein [Runella sp. MFBS21]